MLVRTVFRPDVMVDVDKYEYEDLRRQGLLVDDRESVETAERLRSARKVN
jgi:hypothetical protein